jgi:K+-transporting ATPase ATPase B chain
MAEGRGKAHADELRKMRTKTTARRLVGNRETAVPSSELKIGDLIVCTAGDVIGADGEVVEGIATVDESAITGESAPVIRESGGDRSAVTGGTRVTSDRIVIRVTAEEGSSFLDRMIAMIEGARRQLTPNEIALNIVLISLTALFIVVVLCLPPMAIYNEKAANQTGVVLTSLPVLLSLIVCLIPTTIGGLLSAIGIAGIDRLMRRNVLATSGRAVEAAGDVDVLLLDKTGTITLGNRMATEFVPAPGVELRALADAAQLASLADETPEGRSIVSLAKDEFNMRGRDVADSQASFVKFYGADAHERHRFWRPPDPQGRLRKREGLGAVAWRRLSRIEVAAWSRRSRATAARRSSWPRARPCSASSCSRTSSRAGSRSGFQQLRAMGIRTVMITGDNPLTAAAIAAEAGVDDFIAQAKPEDKLARIRKEQEGGKLIAMIGDGTNDAPSLAQADVGVAMNTGTQAAREAGNMVDLDSNPTKLIEVVEIGKQLLMTRGALTTFSIANDVSKYFAILPAMFGLLYATEKGGFGPLQAYNIMYLHSPQSAILSAVIFNALIIVALIPLALRGVKYQPLGAKVILRKNMLIYGVGGIIVPFVFIKLIDIVLVATHLAP